MKKGLLRVLDVRRLLEDLATLDLETKATELRRLETLVEEHRRLVTETRGATVQRLLNGPAGDAWLAMADADLLSWKKDRLKSAAQSVSEEVAGLAEKRVARRVERKQAEALLAEAAHTEEQERLRREQHSVDDWFQNLRSPGSRRQR